MSDHAERWVYRLGAAAPLVVPWLIAPFQSALREGRHHIGKQIVGPSSDTRSASTPSSRRDLLRRRAKA